MAKWDILDRRRLASSKPLAEHVTDFHQTLLDKDRTVRHADLTRNRIDAILAGCGFTYWSDLAPDRVLRFLGERRGNKVGGSARSFNAYLQSVKGFARWMVDTGRASDSPLKTLKGLNAKVDRRHQRRPLTVEEMRWLLDTTASGSDNEGMTGTDRSMLYRLAVETALRSSELRSLTRASFNLDVQPPTVTVLAAYAKNRKEARQELRPDTATALRDFLAKKLPDATAFNMPPREHVARMFRADLEAARTEWLKNAPDTKTRAEWDASDFLKYRDGAGRVADFHSLRHTCGSWLTAAGVHPKVIQSIMRHSTITLTMDVYGHRLVEQETTAIGRLPDLSVPPASQSARLTGTDGQLPSPACAVLAPEGGQTRTDLTKPGRSARKGPIREKASVHAGNVDSLGDSSKSGEQAAVGFEPTNNGFAIRRLGPLGYAATDTSV